VKSLEDIGDGAAESVDHVAQIERISLTQIDRRLVVAMNRDGTPLRLYHHDGLTTNL